jgi:hypothetical protein
VKLKKENTVSTIQPATIPTIPKEHFLSQPYLNLPSVVSSDKLDGVFVKELASVIFPKKDFEELKTTIIDYGCGRGFWTEHLRDAGYAVDGVDHYPPEGKGFIEADLREWQSPLIYDYGLCVDVVMYMTRKEIREQFLPKYFAAFSEAALLYCCDGSLDVFVDPGAITLPSVEWLRDACEDVGGLPAVCSFYSEWEGSQLGPSILWLKKPQIPGESLADTALRVSRKFRSLNYTQYTTAI